MTTELDDSPPPGFVLEEDNEAPPPGFVLEDDEAPPPGFVLVEPGISPAIEDTGKGRVMSGLAQAGQSLYEGIGTAITGLATVGQRIDEARLGGDETATQSELKSLQSTIAKAEAKGLNVASLKERAKTLEGGLRSFGQAAAVRNVGGATRGVGESFEPNPAYAGEFLASTVPQVAGSAGASIAQLATGAGPALLFGQAYQATLERNLSKGTSVAKAHERALQEGIISGGLEAVGTGIVAGVAKRLAGKMANPSRLKDVATGVVSEFLTGSAQETTSQLIDEEKLEPLKIVKAGALEAMGAGMVIAPAIGIGKLRQSLEQAPEHLPIVEQGNAVASGDLQAAAATAQEALSTPAPSIEPEATAIPGGPISGVLGAPAPVVEATPAPEPFVQRLHDIVEGRPVTLFHGSPNIALKELKPYSSLTLSKSLAEKFAGKKGSVYEANLIIPKDNPAYETARDILADLESGKIDLATAETQYANRVSEIKNTEPVKTASVASRSKGPGAAAATEFPSQDSTSLKKAVVREERLARGLDDLPPAERQAEEPRVQRAENAVDNDSTLAPKLVAKIVDDGTTNITADDAAVLLVERTRLMNERTKWEDEATDPARSGRNQDYALTKLAEIEVQTEKLDQAQRAAGSAWGRLGHLYQRLLREDFTLEPVLRRARLQKGGALTAEESARFSQQVKKIAILEKEVSAQQGTIEKATENAGVSRTYQETVRRLESEIAARPQYSKEVFDIARSVVNRWKADAEIASKNLRGKLGRTSAGVDPTIILDAARIMRAYIGELGLNFAETSTRMIAEFGEALEPHLKKAWVKAQNLIGKENAPPKVKEAVKAGLAPKKTTQSVKARAKAESIAGEELSHKTVYDLARAHVEAGVRGEDALMAAVHQDIKEFYPNATERDVRRAYSEYGKVKFPSREEAATHLRETRTLVRLQESIDRELAGLPSLHTGLQRDRASQSIRLKQARLTELLKQRKGPPSPEQLASNEQVRITAAKNAIEDLDRELRTGEARIKSQPAMPGPELERLQAELSAMRELKKSIQQAARIAPTPEEAYNKGQATRLNNLLKEAQRRIKEGDFAKQPKKVPLQLSAANQKARFELSRLKREITQGQFDLALKNRTGREKIKDTTREVFHTIRAIMTGGEFSGVLRQGKFALASRPIVTTKGALPAMFRAAWSEAREHAEMDKILNRDNAPLYQSSGLAIHDPYSFTAAQLEGNYRSRWANKIPLIAGSGRAYTVFLNRLRADVFDVLKAKFETRNGIITPAELKNIAQFINEQTGSGGLGVHGTKAVGFLNAVYFAPKFTMSRVQMLLGHSLWSKGSTLATRRLILEEYARIGAGMAVMYGLYSAFLQDDDERKKIEKDLRSGKGGKLPVGKSFLDPLAGELQIATLGTRIVMGETKSAKGKVTSLVRTNEKALAFGVRNMKDVLFDFNRSKMSPIAGAALDEILRETFLGDALTLKTRLAKLPPITYQQVYQTMTIEENVPKGLALSVLGLMGENVSTFDPAKK